MSSGAAVFVLGPAGSGKVFACMFACFFNINLIFGSIVLYSAFSPLFVNIYWNIVKVLDVVLI